MAARGRVNSSKSMISGTHVSLPGRLRVAGVLLLVTGSLLYLSMLTSPGFLRRISQNLGLQCHDDFGQYTTAASPNFILSTPKLPSDAARNYNNVKALHSIRESSPSTLKTTLDESIECTCDGNKSTGQQLTVQERIAVPPETSAEQPAKFRILVGVLTMAGKIDRRNLLRLAYAGQSSPDAHVSVRFVMGALEGESDQSKVERTLVGMENATYGDIIVLNCRENLNEGKTYAYFSSLPGMGPEYDYVMKTDDDSYVRFDNLGKSLKPLSRTDLYYGYILPCENKDAYISYMAGMGYLISWDLVLWITDSPIARNKSIGTEDHLVGDWFNEGGVAKHRVNEKPRFYDHPGFGGQCAHELVPDTILVHQVKTPERWADVLSFFEKDRISTALSGHGQVSLPSS